MREHEGKHKKSVETLIKESVCNDVKLWLGGVVLMMITASSVQKVDQALSSTRTCLQMQASMGEMAENGEYTL
jgi:hypothetical protein